MKRPIIDKDGSANQILGASTDITERKQAESELQHNRQQLAHVTRISTMGELAASLAHELNQPLTAILSNAQAAQRFMAAKPADLEEVQTRFSKTLSRTTAAPARSSSGCGRW